MDNVAEALVEHYEKTYELTHDLWTERNRIFLLLLGSIAGVSLLTLSPKGLQPLLIALSAWLAKTVEIKDASSLVGLLPVTLLQGILLRVVFYFMFSLYTDFLTSRGLFYSIDETGPFAPGAPDRQW